MTKKEIIKCSCGNKFPINKDKHKNRNYRICNNCKAKIQISGLSIGWKPNLNWIKEKLFRKEEKRKEKAERERERQVHSSKTSDRMSEEYWRHTEERMNK